MTVTVMGEMQRKDGLKKNMSFSVYYGHIC